MTKITAVQFFETWCKKAAVKEDVLLRAWNEPGKLTDLVLNSQSPLIADVAISLELQVYCEYYCIDAVLYKDEDKVKLPTSEVTLRQIRVAFEHENNFQSGLFREISHLLITSCDLRVLVSYPSYIDEINDQLEYLHKTISGVDDKELISENESLLFIMGWALDKAAAIAWYGFVYKRSGWKLILPFNWDTIKNIEGVIDPSDFRLSF